MFSNSNRDVLFKHQLNQFTVSEILVRRNSCDKKGNFFGFFLFGNFESEKGK